MTKKAIQSSDNATVEYYGDGSYYVENADKEVEFAQKKKVQGTSVVDEDGCITFTPNGAGGHGPRYITIFDNGVVRFKKSPHGTNIKMELIMKRTAAGERNIRHQIAVAFDEIREAGINIKEA